MSLPPDEAIARFLRRHAYGTDADKLSQITLKHQLSKNGQIKSWPFSKRDTDVDDLQVQILELAQEHASGIGGMQKYVVGAVYPSGVQTLTIRVFGGDDDDDASGSSSDKSSIPAVVAALIRYNETLTRCLIETTTSTNQVLAKTVQEQQAQIAQQNNERVEAIVLQEQMLSMQADRELAAMMAKAKNENQQKLLQNLLMLAPSVVNRIAGREVLPEQVSPALQAIKGVFTSLTEEQMSKLTDILTPAQTITVLDLYQKFLENPNAPDGAPANPQSETPSP